MAPELVFLGSGLGIALSEKDFSEKFLDRPSAGTPPPSSVSFRVFNMPSPRDDLNPADLFHLVLASHPARGGRVLDSSVIADHQALRGLLRRTLRLELQDPSEVK